MNKIMYEYQDEHKNVLYRKVRIPGPDNTKKFYCERNNNGETIQNMDGCRQVLYQLPEVLYGISHDMPIFLVEGEKDAETLLKHSLKATTTHNTGIWPEEFTKTLENADVCVSFSRT